MDLAVGSIDYAMDELERVRPFIKLHVFDTVSYHLTMARNALQAGAKDPIRWDVLFVLLSALNQNLQADREAYLESKDNFSIVDDGHH